MTGVPRENLDVICRTMAIHLDTVGQLDGAIGNAAQLIQVCTQWKYREEGCDELILAAIAGMTVAARQLTLLFGEDKIDPYMQTLLVQLKDKVRADRREAGQKTPNIGDKTSGRENI